MTKLAQQLKRGAGQALESLSEGWREPGLRSVSGHKRYERELASTRYALVQSAFGGFSIEVRAA